MIKKTHVHCAMHADIFINDHLTTEIIFMKIHCKNRDDSAKNASCHIRKIYLKQKMRILVFVILVNSQYVTKRENKLAGMFVLNINHE